jgi:pimeloyl-ACP methyl ester carboxylesterase
MSPVGAHPRGCAGTSALRYGLEWRKRQARIFGRGSVAVHPLANPATPCDGHHLPSIGVPVLLLADPADQIVPIMTAHRLAAELPDARLHLVEHAGHHLPRRAPGAVAEATTGFLAAIDNRQVRQRR